MPESTRSSPRSAARTAVLGDDAPPPRGVVVVLIDTLRRDYFQPYGHARDNAPFLTAMAAEGALFEDAIAQGTWTKVSAPAILTSLYPATHGISDTPDRLPAAVTTLAEAYRAAGYATFATSSVPFTGRLSNLHQGVDVLHERSSIPGVPINYAKTARTYADRLIPWLEEHRDVPFFAFLHVFDPHTPFEPYPPYDAMWMEPDALVEHREDMKRVADEIDHTFRKEEVLPFASELEAAGVDRDTFLAREKTWYDASIRAMDVEIGRVIERLRELGLSESTLVAVISDHGEEFLEHGRHFHGYKTPRAPKAGLSTSSTTTRTTRSISTTSRRTSPSSSSGSPVSSRRGAKRRSPRASWRTRGHQRRRATAPAKPRLRAVGLPLAAAPRIDLPPRAIHALRRETVVGRAVRAQVLLIVAVIDGERTRVLDLKPCP